MSESSPNKSVTDEDLVGLNTDNYINKIIRQSTTSNSLKLKGLGGALYPSRGACSIIDKPR